MISPTVSDATGGGALDGFTLLRFAHAFESGGGMERLLEDLDGVLLERNAMTIVRLHIASDRTHLEERTVARGRGRLVLAPLPLPEGEGVQLAPDQEVNTRSLKERFRDRVLYHPLVWAAGLERLILRRPLPRRTGQVVGAGAKAAEMFARFPVNLSLLHFFGGSDADEIVAEARRHGIPFALQNHSENRRYLHLSVRKHATLANAVAGVNGLDVPAYVAGRFRNLADGIDTDFFRREAARPVPSAPTAPMILLPARVVRPKGHLDLVAAAARLRDAGVAFSVGFAGRVESSQFVEELRGEIVRAGLVEHVHFLGALSTDALRDWYAASTVVTLPTSHHEGLGRVIVEAQAMETPVVAYATGGTPEAIVDGTTGYLVRTGDVDGLTQKLAHLLAHPDERRRMGRAGRQAAETRYSLAAVAARHEAFYLELTGGAQPALNPTRELISRHV